MIVSIIDEFEVNLVSKIIKFTSDSAELSPRVKIGGVPYAVDPASVVKAMMFDSENNITADVTLSSTAPAADWTVGLMYVSFPEVEMDKLTAGNTATLQLRIAEPGLVPKIGEIGGILIKQPYPNE